MVGGALPLRAHLTHGDPVIMSNPLPRRTFWTNLLLFQLGWFAVVLSAAHGMPWIALLTTSLLLLWHLCNARVPARELTLAGFAVVFGVLFETIMVQLGILTPASGVLVNGAAAYWLVCLWVLFATTFNVSLRWLRPRPMMAALLGSVGGPLAYLGGARLGALDIDASYLALATLAFGWGLAMPILLWTAARFDGYGAA